MEKQNLFKKKLTVEKTDNGYAVAVYGKVTGQVYSTPERAQEEIDKINQAKKQSNKK